MKPIELTINYRNMLLGMCETLFPEKGSFKLEIEPQYDGTNGFIFFENMTDEDYDDVIHWFEFTFKLLNKMLENEKSPVKITRIVSNYALICFNTNATIHPVDFLYEEFLKINPK